MVLNNVHNYVLFYLTYSFGLKSVNSTQRKGAAAVNDTGNDDNWWHSVTSFQWQLGCVLTLLIYVLCTVLHCVLAACVLLYVLEYSIPMHITAY